MIRHSALVIVLVGIVTPSVARAAPQAVILPAAAEQWCNGQHDGEMVTLAVVDGERILAHEDRCRYFGENLSVQASVDGRGKIYMLVRDHTPTFDRTSRTTDLLRVLELESADAGEADPYELRWMADLVLSPPGNAAAPWPATYRVRAAAGGGLEVIVDYSPVRGEDCCTPPEKQVSIQIGP